MEKREGLSAFREIDTKKLRAKSLDTQIESEERPEGLIILGANLEIALRMVANGADFGSLLAYDDVSAVGALPYTVTFAAEHEVALDVGQEFAIAFLVFLLDSSYHFELCGDFGIALFASYLGKSGIHVGPFVVLACGSVLQVVCRAGHSAVKHLEPNLGVLLFVLCRLLEDGSHLNITVLLSFGCVILVLGVSL